MWQLLICLSTCSIFCSATQTRARSKSIQGALRLLNRFKHKNQKVIGGGLAEALTWDPNEFGPAPKKEAQPKAYHRRLRTTSNSTASTLRSVTTTLPPPDWRAREAATQWAWEAKVNETRREAANAAQAAVVALESQNTSSRQDLNVNASIGEDSGDSRLFRAKDNTTAVVDEKIHLLKEGTALLQKKLHQKESKLAVLQKAMDDLQHSLAETNADEGKLMKRMKSANEPAQREMLALEFSEMDLLEEATALQERLHSLEEAAVVNSSQATSRSPNPKTSDPRIALLEAKLQSLDAGNAKLVSADAHQQQLKKELGKESAIVSREDRKLSEGRPSLQAQVVHNAHVQKQLIATQKVADDLHGAATKLAQRQQSQSASQLSMHVKQMKKAIEDGARRVSLLQGDQQVWRLQHTQQWAQLIRLQKASRILAKEHRKLASSAKAESEVAANAEHQDLAERAKLRRVAAQLQHELRNAGALY